VESVDEPPLVNIISGQWEDCQYINICAVHLKCMYQKAVEKEVEMILKEGVIEPCVSKWASPMVHHQKEG